ncbi:arabinan endo-1,5-alpha-L-arabinosidase [Cystobacter ferrugineus]|uniref:Arabinan endo-1,5-alpha-L-arabinosidase n=1 Tax=Cystobacter ferrugineus TaxID=83449 RepID=A0A1L9B6S2_9BACT|nr:arabinan endo-1,5-alpha-L-arabinosidase [Cystobacter ferrugineus]
MKSTRNDERAGRRVETSSVRALALAPLLLAATLHCGDGATPSQSTGGDNGPSGGSGGTDVLPAPAPGTEGAGPGHESPGGEALAAECLPGTSGNPFVSGRYADPDMKFYNGRYWVYPTYSAPYNEQTYLDAFSSPDLINWTKHSKVLDKVNVSWATRAIWAPSPIFRNNTYYLYFGANDIQNDGQLGGIGVAKSDNPAGPFVDAIGRPLIGKFVNGAQPIDQNIFIDDDGQAYLYYGGHGHCNVVKVNADMISLDSSSFKEITPSGYVEGALMFKRQGKYYLMWSEGGWTGPDYRVSYAIANSPLGPFPKLGTILSQNAAIGTGSGHNTVINVPGTDDWYIFYHRRPLGETDGNHRVLAYDRMYFNSDGTIKPVEMSSQDNFCDGNALGWSTYGATWSVANGRYVTPQVPDAKALLNTNFSALIYEADVTPGASGDAGLMFRVSSPGAGLDAYKGYYAGIAAGSDRVVLGKAGGGTWTELASAAATIDPNVTYHLSVQAIGSRISVYLNRSTTPIVTAIDSTYASGAIGLRAHDSAAAFDNVNTSKPPGATFYADGGFGGLGISLSPGNYTLTQLNAAGIPNDWMSSLRVPAGWTVDVYADDNFTGTMWKFTADASLIPPEANDKMSSVKIFAP